MIISIGTASTVPQMPQIQLQNSSPTKIATGFICAARPMSIGVSRKPSRLVIANVTAQTYVVLSGSLNSRNATTPSAPVTITGPTLSNKKATVQILNDISEQIATFIRVQILTSVIVAVATGLALWAFGLEQYIVWGLLAGLFNSIPYLGPVIVTAALGFVALLEFNDPVKTIYLCAVTFAITSLEGFLLTPSLMGRAAQMNPVAIFVGLLFWSWIWGIWGTILAVPMLMMLKAICDHVEDLQPIGELLGE